MPKEIDILLDPQTGDIYPDTTRDKLGQLGHGLFFGEATAQHQAIVLETQKGEFKEYPTLGVGLINMTHDDDQTGWRREISLQLESIGMKVTQVDINIQTGKLTVDASYSK